MKNYEFHDLANIFPMLDAEGLEELRADVEKNGQIDPIYLYDGKVLDGRNRYTVCAMLGITPKTVEYTGNDPLAFAVSKNLKRRHLTASQRAAIAAEVANMPVGRNWGGNVITESSVIKVSQTEAGKQFKVSEDYIQQAKKVKESAPEVFEMVKAGTVGLQDAARIAKMDEERRETVVAKIESGDAVPDAIREAKRQEVVDKLEDIAMKEVKASQGVYDVIVIDPPWEMKKIERNERPNQVEFDYPTMTEEELAAMNLPAADDCHLWCWTTHKHLPMAFRLLEAWGFKYTCTFVWHKPGGFQVVGLPQYNCEFALYARKGTPQFVDTKAFFTCFEAERTGHSAKPEEFYNVVRKVTAGRRSDVFGRRKIEGFDSWGNEVD